MKYNLYRIGSISEFKRKKNSSVICPCHHITIFNPVTPTFYFWLNFFQTKDMNTDYSFQFWGWKKICTHCYKKLQFQTPKCWLYYEYVLEWFFIMSVLEKLKKKKVQITGYMFQEAHLSKEEQNSSFEEIYILFGYVSSSSALAGTAE